jgi:hypothetical protein
VYDVTVDDISITANYRNQFTRVIDQQGFDGLMSAMRKKQQELRQSRAWQGRFSQRSVVHCSTEYAVAFLDVRDARRCLLPLRKRPFRRCDEGLLLFVKDATRGSDDVSSLWLSNVTLRCVALTDPSGRLSRARPTRLSQVGDGGHKLIARLINEPPRVALDNRMLYGSIRGQVQMCCFACSGCSMRRSVPTSS